MGQLFGTDGIRGVANTELTPELALGLGRALVRTLLEEGVTRPRVTVGRDTRASGEMLSAALIAGICSAGGDATDVGIIPTPGVAHLVAAGAADGGVMISASHNPIGDNGIKILGPAGFKLTDAEEHRVEELLQRTADDRPVDAKIGRLLPDPRALTRYADHLLAASTIDDVGGLHVVADCADGAAAPVAPGVLERLGCRVTAIHAEPDGTTINDGCGSTHPQTVAAAVVETGADLGVAFDGDADRLVAVDHTGAVVDGDAILAILALDRHRHGALDTVVTTVMTNLGFMRAMEAHGIEVVQTKVGDRYVLEAMRAGGLELGGEQSGHLILLDHATTGDGILAAVRLLGVIRRTGSTLAELASVMTRLPQVLVNVRGVDRHGLDGADDVWRAVADAEAQLGDAGRVLLRPSGTEPVVRVMVEATEEPTAQAVADRLAAVVATSLGQPQPA